MRQIQVMLNGIKMTTATPKTPELDKALVAQGTADILIPFITWASDQGFLDWFRSPEELLAIYYNIDLDILADEDEAWDIFLRGMERELHINE